MDKFDDYYESPDFRMADDIRGELIRLGMMEAATEGAGQGMPRANSQAAEIFGGEESENSGFGVVAIPPDLFDADVRHVQRPPDKGA